MQPYPFSLRLLDSFDDPELAQRFLMDAYPLVNLGELTDDEIRTHKKMALLERVQRDIHLRDILELVPEIIFLLKNNPLSHHHFHQLLCYRLQEGESEHKERFLSQLAENSQPYREDIMTIAQQLRQEGRQEGLDEGRKAVARSMLSHNEPIEKIMNYTGLSEADVMRLQTTH